MRVISAVGICSLFVGVALGETTITINGKTIRTSGNNITVNNNTVIVDGQVLSGNVVEGSGKKETEIRSFANFSEIYLNLDADITITAGEKSQCKITADNNLFPLILTESSGNALHIFPEESYISNRKMTIAIETPLITRAETTGSGTINITMVTEEKVSLVISGSGVITAKGEVTNLEATINGSGHVNTSSLRASTATIKVNGSGKAHIHAANELTASVRGSGDITYIGTPSTINASAIGSGTIAKR